MCNAKMCNAKMCNAKMCNAKMYKVRLYSTMMWHGIVVSTTGYYEEGPGSNLARPRLF